MKIASRYLLPLELYMAVVLLSWGLSGWFGGGLLWKTLEKSGQNTEWGLALCSIAAAQLLLTAAEWCFGRRWPSPRLFACVTVRMWLALASTGVWIYVVYMMATLRGADMVFSLALQAPAGVLFSLWVLVGNLKVACLLDPSCPTENLKRTIQADRERLLSGL